jgi:hypothetical protein
MARGQATGGGYASNAVTSGVNARAETTAANSSLAGGGDVKEAVARVQNAGGGEVKVSADQVGDVVSQTPMGVLQAADGSIVVDGKRVGIEGVAVVRPDGTVEEAKGAAVKVGPGGVESVKFGGSTFVVQKTKVDVTKNQRDGLLTVNLPPSLRGVALDKQGNINGWRINPKAIPDKAVRAWLYQNLSKDGTLKFPSNSPVAAKLSALLSKAGYARVPVGKVNEILNATPEARYVAGTKAGLRAAFGAAQKQENERQG